MKDDIRQLRDRLERLERELGRIQKGPLDWLVHVPRETFLGPWPDAAPPSATRLVRQLRALTESESHQGQGSER